MVSKVLLIILVGGITVIADPTPPTCQIPHETAESIVQTLRNSPDIEQWSEDAKTTTYYRRSDQTLWWVATHLNPAYPTILCRAPGQPVQAKCGTDQLACRKMIIKMSKVKF